MTPAMVRYVPELFQRLQGTPSTAMWHLIWRPLFALTTRTERFHFFRSRLATADRSDSIRPAIDRVTAGLAFPVLSGGDALLPILLDGGFSGVVFLAIVRSFREFEF
jgi:hypothetical protein